MATSKPGGPSRPIAERGAQRTIEYAVRADGTSPAREFVEGLAIPDQMKLARLFKRLADDGQIRDGEKFKRLERDIWEFKIRTRDTGARVPCFADGKAWVLTHGFLKKEDRAPPSEIALAERIRSEDLSRTKPPKAGQ